MSGSQPPKSRPKPGEDILLFNYALDKFKGFARVKTVLNEGLIGWIVEASNYMLIEVEPAGKDDDAQWKEVARPATKEPRNAKHS